MGQRKITVRISAAYQIAEVSFYIESKGLVKTAEKFSESVYNYIEKLAASVVRFKVCREPKRKALGLKCVSFRKKYTIVFIDDEDELMVIEFIPSKLIHW